MKARIFVTLKDGVLDPQGQAIQGALGALGFDGVDLGPPGQGLRDRACRSRDDAEARLRAMCEKLLRQYGDRGFRVEIADASSDGST